MKKRIVSLLLIVLILCGMVLSVSAAHEIPQDRTDCSIELSITYSGYPLTGGTLTAVRIGYVAEDDGNYFFQRYVDDALVENVDSPDTAEALEKFYQENNKTYAYEIHRQQIKDGIVKFTDLPTGLYLIVQEVPTPTFGRMKAFLVSVPYKNEDGYQYHVSATIKSELEKEPEMTRYTEPDDKLPQTGQLNWPVPLMACAGLALFALGWALCYAGKKEGYEE